MAEEPDARRQTLERDIGAWERRALKAEVECDQVNERLRKIAASAVETARERDEARAKTKAQTVAKMREGLLELNILWKSGEHWWVRLDRVEAILDRLTAPTGVVD